MKRILYSLALVFALSVVGCGTPETDSGKTDGNKKEVKKDDHDDHKAPNDGILVEIGHDHKHAEVIDDHDADMIHIDFLDSAMKPMPIGADTISVLMTHGEESHTFELKKDAAISHRYSSSDENLHHELEEEGVNVKIRATIDGKPVSGSFVTKGGDHDDGHGHDDDKKKGGSEASHSHDGGKTSHTDDDH